MDTTSLQPLMQRFLEALSSDPELQEHQEQHDERVAHAQRVLKLENIPQLTREEIEDFLQDTDAWAGIRGRERLFRGLFGENDERLPELKETLAELAQRAQVGLDVEGCNELRKALPWIGPAYFSEILALRFPDQYWVWNKPVRAFLDNQGIDVKDELPWGKKGDLGAQYMVAGQHIGDVRRSLSEVAGQSVDYLKTDLFMFWANQQERPGKKPGALAEKIERWQSEMLPQERIQARQEGEERARALLDEKLGQFDEADLRQFLQEVSTDWYNDSIHHDRFMPALYGAQVNRMIETLDKFNEWVARLWKADDTELDDLLDTFWKKLEVSGAGISLPTVILYLRAPKQYNIWLPVMSTGLETAAGFDPGKMRTARGYRRYNEALNRFREVYQLPPQALDVILWSFARSEETEPEEQLFPGFTEDTFQFLQELSENNTDEWMAKDGEANKARYRRVLREPLRSLFKAVAPTVTEMDPVFETEAKFGKVLASFRKRFPDEEGAYHTYLWGAFYRQGHTKQTDTQLFVIIHPNHVNVGLCVAGSRGSNVLDQFRRNLEQAPDFFLQLLQELPEDVHINVADRHGVMEGRTLDIEGPEDLTVLMEDELINIERRYPADTPILYEPEFADEVASLFQALYPLYRFTTTDDLDEVERLIEIDFEEEVDELYSLDQLMTETFLDESFWMEVDLLLRDKKQIIFYGPPGTGKTWVARELAKYWVDAAPEPSGEIRSVQFHPSYAYEEFVEGIRPQSIEGPDGYPQLSYPVKKGLFREFCDVARTHLHRRYVLILDEINRGELPRILGELLYLLEYRRETIRLPYSGQPFAIPANLYLFGTMNTADRSIALVDHALRRRFHFIEMRPNSDILRLYFEGRGDTEWVWVADLLDMVNEQLSADGIEWHLHIGHSHFMRKSIDDVQLQLIWKHSIMPTIEEYFYRQPDRVQNYRLSKLKAALGKL